MSAPQDPPAAGAEVTRERLHTRRIEMEGFRRSDGLFELEGRVTDHKPIDFCPPSDTRMVKANEPIHNIGVRLVFDAQRVIREVHTFIEAYPYAQCPGGGDSLQALVGVRIGAGWGSEIRKRLPSSETCAHLKEILIPMASAVIQSLSATEAASHDAVDAQGKPMQIDSCYTYGASREIVMRRWPQFGRTSS